MVGCKIYADKILNNIAAEVAAHKADGSLVVISVGDNPASASYIKGKRADCERVGFLFREYHFDSSCSKDEIISLIDLFNKDQSTTGIIVQLPLPEPLAQHTDEIVGAVAPEKDVDGFVAGSHFKPCTPEGVVYVLKEMLGTLEDKCIVVLGRGKLVGRPLVQMLIDENANVTCLHSHTSKENVYDITTFADAIVTAVGVPYIWGTSSFGMEDKEIPIIDVGCNRDENGKLCGDVARDSFVNQTSVPGGMGLMTRAMLIMHTRRVGR